LAVFLAAASLERPVLKLYNDGVWAI